MSRIAFLLSNFQCSDIRFHLIQDIENTLYRSFSLKLRLTLYDLALCKSRLWVNLNLH